MRIPEPEFRVEELGDSSVNIWVLVWHPRDDWSQAQPHLLTTIKRALASQVLKSHSRKEWFGKQKTRLFFELVFFLVFSF